MGPTAGLSTMEERKHVYSRRESNPFRTARSLFLNRLKYYTDASDELEKIGSLHADRWLLTIY